MTEAAPPAIPFQPAHPAVAQLTGAQDPQPPSPIDLVNGSSTQDAATPPSYTNGTSGGPAQEVSGPPASRVGWAQSHGNRAHQDDRCVEFPLRLPSGDDVLVWAVADGHHQHHVAQLVCEELPAVLTAAVAEQPSLDAALRTAIRRLDDVVFARHAQGLLSTGGTTLIVHILTPTHVHTANVGDCKSVLSSRGACVELNTCHNPNVPSERDRFQAVGIYCSADHIGGSDINVCRTLGDYDLGLPLKGRDAEGRQLGPLISEPEVCAIPLDELSEFVITASDGLWDYYSPESSVLSDTRRSMRRLEEDPQQVAEWLLEQALAHQQRTLHPGTPGDNITVMVVKLRPLPPLPRSTGSRLCLARGGSGDLLSPKGDLTSPKCTEAGEEPGVVPAAVSPQAAAGLAALSAADPARQQQLQRQASHQEALLRQHSSSLRGAFDQSEADAFEGGAVQPPGALEAMQPLPSSQQEARHPCER